MTLRRLLVSLSFLVSAVALQAGYVVQWSYSNLSGLPAADQPSHLFAADLNGDGRTDVITHSAANGMWVALAQNDGTLGASTSVYTAAAAFGAEIGEVTNDGKVDVIVTDSTTKELVVLPGNGDGAFGAAIRSTVTIVGDLVAADFNRDGKIDVAIRSDADGQYAIYAGSNDGRFTPLSSANISGTTGFRAGDVDHDGDTDLVFRTSSPLGFALYFGNGDGTFDAPVAVSADVVPSDYQLADLDGDDDLDIVSGESSANTVSVRLNTGARTFAPVVSYFVDTVYYNNASNVRAVAVGDVNEDTFPDIVVTLASAKMHGTLTGFGNGAFHNAITTSSGFQFGSPGLLVLGNVAGNGRLDAVMGRTTNSGSALALFRNRAGETNMTASRDAAVVTVGQTATYKITVNALITPSEGDPAPTGTVTLKNGATTLGSAELVNRTATLSTNALPAGTHALTVVYNGDGNFRTNTASVTQNVVTEKSFVTLTTSPLTSSVEYGHAWSFVADVTSEVAGDASGSVWLYVDGVKNPSSTSAPHGEWSVYNELAVGVHTVRAVYTGDTTHPTAESANVNVTLLKEPSKITTTAGDALTLTAGQSSQIAFTVAGLHYSGSRKPAGNLVIYDGLSQLTTVAISGGWVNATIPALAAGVHYLRFQFDGNDDYGASSLTLRASVLPSTGLTLDAFVNGNAIDVVLPYRQLYNQYYLFYRRIDNGAWETWQQLTNAYHEAAPQAGKVYTYRVELYEANTYKLLETSNADSAMLATFTDQPLWRGSVIKAQHMTEILSAVNTMRSAAGLAAVSFNDLAKGLAPRAWHITYLRAALNEARTALGSTPVTFSGSVAAGGVIRASDVQNLRDALR